MKPKTNTERHAALCARRKKAGLKMYRNFWGHPDDESAIKAFASACRLTRAAMERAKA